MQLQPNPYEDYETFKDQSAGLLYDYYYPHKLDWPASCCRWGGVQYRTEEYQHQDVVFGCRTDGVYNERANVWQGLSSMLVMGSIDVPAPGYKLGPKQAAGNIGRRAMTNGKRYEDPNQRIEVSKVIIHPGEINCVKCWPKNQKVLATHSDTKYVYIWDMKSQKNASDRINVEANIPDLVLEGHTAMAAYALEWHPNEPIVASGGHDRQILLWNIEHYFNSHGKIPEEEKEFNLNQLKDEVIPTSNGGNPEQDQSQQMSRIQKSLQSYLSDPKKEQKYKKLEPYARLTGHSGNVEDLAFKNDSCNCELVSVGVDRYILFWDLRTDTKKPVNKVLKAHTDDINTVDWCKLDTNYVATGSNDQRVCILDIRRLSSDADQSLDIAESPAAVQYLTGHTASINVVRFSPFQKQYLASSGDSLVIWDLDQPEGSDSQVVFKHAGHVGAIVDFEWNQYSPWSLMSASDDIDPTSIALGACSLQVYRPLDLLVSQTEDQAVESLQQSYENAQLDSVQNPLSY